MEPTEEDLLGLYEIKVETITSESLVLYEDTISVEVTESLVVNFDQEFSINVLTGEDFSFSLSDLSETIDRYSKEV